MTAWTIRTRKELGASHYTRHSLVLRGKVIYESLTPISDAEAADRVRQHLYPDPPRPVPPFAYAARGRPKGGSKPRENSYFFNDDEAA